MKKANPALIGIFILGAVGIAIASVVFFGSTKIFSEQVSFVTFFDGDVDGLQIGSKVKLKGIPVGEVKKILIRFQSADGTQSSQPSIPVIFDMDVRTLSRNLGIDIDFSDSELYKKQIEQGLRARLETQSFLTGLLQVNLDYVEDADAPGALEAFDHNGVAYRVIPAAKSEIQEAKQDVMTAVANFSETDFKGIAERLSKLLETLTVKFEELKPREINEAVAAMKNRVNSEDVDKMLSWFAEAGAKLSSLTDKIDKQVGDDDIANILKSTQKTLAAAEKTIESIGVTAGNLESMTNGKAGLRRELERGMKEIGDAAKQINVLAAYLNERPNAILFGRKDEKDDADSTDRPEKKRALIGPGGKLR